MLQQATAIGVKRFVIIGSARVERSYWTSSALRPAAIEEELVLGLEQARDTVLPSVETWPRLAGLRTLVLDMLRYRSHPTHLTVDEAIGTAEQIAATNTWFIHMTHEILHAELDAALPPGMRLGHDGLVLSDES